jgi:hypothetical protein
MHKRYQGGERLDLGQNINAFSKAKLGWVGYLKRLREMLVAWQILSRLRGKRRCDND